MDDIGARKLLAVLDSDPARASEKFANLRLNLLRYFEWNHAASPEDLAQEVLCRALARVNQGQSVFAANPKSYFFGIARNVLFEHWKRVPDPLPISAASGPCLASSGGLAEMERELLLSECLDQLPPDDRELIVRYYGEGSDEVLAGLSISSNALRIRIHRIKTRMEQWARANDSF